MTWKERKPPESGKWRVIEAFRIKDLTPNLSGTSPQDGQDIGEPAEPSSGAAEQESQ